MDKDNFSNFESQNNSTEKHEKIKIESFFETVKGENHFKNEDCVFSEGNEFFVLTDGVGGRFFGEEAAKLAGEYVLDHFKEIPNDVDIKKAKQVMAEIVVGANYAVLEASKFDTAHEGMSTTLVAVKIFIDKEGKNYALVANVGDSRAYKISKDGQLQQITVDDDILCNYISDKSERLEIAKKLANAKDESDFEGNKRMKMFFQDRRFITNSVGTAKLEPFTVDAFPIEKGDRIFLTSDGIHDNLTTDELQEIIKQSKTVEEAVKNIMLKSKERSEDFLSMRAKKDDMSILGLEIKS